MIRLFQRKRKESLQSSLEERVLLSFESMLMLRHYALDLHQPTLKILGFQSGQLSSRLRGRGVDFEQVRLYQPGDDIRYIDWRVTARHRRPYSKVFLEEKNRPAFIVLDQRRSLFFGSKNKMKSVLACQIAGILAGSVLKSKDRLGTVIFNDERVVEIRPQASTQNFQRFCKEATKMNAALLENNRPIPILTKDTLEETFKSLACIVKPGSLVMIVSDFHQASETIMRYLPSLAEHNQVMCFRIYDPLEEKLPMGNLTYTNGVQKMTLTPDDARVCTRFSDHAKHFKMILEKTLLQKRIPLYHCSTEEDPFLTLKKLFHQASPSMRSR